MANFEEFEAKVKAAILEHDPEEVATFDELAAKKAAYYIYYGMGVHDYDTFPNAGNVYELYDVIKFVAGYKEGE